VSCAVHKVTPLNANRRRRGSSLRGIVITAGPNSASEGRWALGIQTDGKLIGAGSVGVSPQSRFALARYLG